MSTLFDYYRDQESPFLEALAEDLEGTFKVIAYAHEDQDRDFIRQRQREIKETYGRNLSNITLEIGILKILPAYDALQELLYNNPDPRQIIERCEDALTDHLTPSEPEEGYEEAFEEFYSGEE